MDEQAAKQLLKEIRGQEKQAFSGAGIGGPNMYSPSPAAAKATPLLSQDQLRQRASSRSNKNRNSQITTALLMALTGGAALRGGLGLMRMFDESKPVPSKTIDMDVPIPGEEEKKSNDSLYDKAFDAIGMGPKSNPNATSNIGVGSYLPSLLLGTPLAFAGGWKGMDMLFDSQRKARNQRKVDKAKEEYEQEVLNAYKQGSDNALPTEKLDAAFDSLEKAALWGAENIPGALKGLALTYAALSTPAAYMYVNDKMKKNSRRAILEKAMRERARRSAKQQPLELYAKPTTVEEEDN